MQADIKSSLKKLYEEDFVLWVDETVKQLKNKDVINLDGEHLIEEIYGLRISYSTTR